jgi:hypothetical protein
MECTFIYTCNISKLWKLLIDEQANINQRELQTFTKWGARFFLVFLFLFFFLEKKSVFKAISFKKNQKIPRLNSK